MKCVLNLTEAGCVKDMLVAIAAGKVVDELSCRDRVDHEELDSVIERHSPDQELVGNVRKRVIQRMVYDACTHVIFMFPGFKGLHRKGAPLIDLVK